MNWLRNKLESFGPKTAFVESGKFWSYHEFLSLIEIAGSGLGQSRVALIQTTSTVEGLAQLIAIAGTEYIALPLPPSLPEAERSHMLELVANSPLYKKLEESGLILFSSGTSGEPKGMLHSLPALLNRFKQVTPREDRTLQLLLLDHIGGLDAAFRCLCSGSTLIIPEDRNPDAAAQAIEAYGVNILPASPTFLNLVLMNGITEKYDCSSVEIIAYGAEAMPQALLKRLGQAFPQADLQQKFGTSETGAVRIQSSSKDSLFFRIKDLDTEWKVIENELWLKTPSRIIGYLNADESSLEVDGWYRTGDLVEEGPNGTLRIIGRHSETINVGGQKVHPSEVEAVLNQIEGIEACYVYGESDSITGQRVACEIASSTEKDLRNWKRAIRNHCRGKLAPWKIPARINLINQPQLTVRLKRS
ncbi:MAG: fatty acid--CoA ligase family protein [Verrucomicrobiota bacterium]